MDRRLLRLLALTFLENTSAGLVERGIYFYTGNQLHYSDRDNLLLALAVGLAYILGALASHRLARALGEKRCLYLLLLGQISALAVLALVSHPTIFVLAVLTRAVLTGAKWPIIESYISAGRDPAGIGRAIGCFNIAWASAVPLSLAAVGPLLEYWPAGWPPGIFLIPLGTCLIVAPLMFSLENRPAHLPLDHPAQLSASELARYRALTTAGRWSMVLSYVLLFLLVPLMKGIFQDRLQLPVQWATASASLLDLSRFLTFLLLQRWTGWHSRRLWLYLALAGLPVGFLLVFTGTHLPIVLAGTLLFGLAAGLAYYSSLYYGMVTHNASVDAGGSHEALIGLGFALGPAAGLIGAALPPLAGSSQSNILLAILPPAVVCISLALHPLLPSRAGPAGEK